MFHPGPKLPIGGYLRQCTHVPHFFPFLKYLSTYTFYFLTSIFTLLSSMTIQWRGRKPTLGNASHFGTLGNAGHSRYTSTHYLVTPLVLLSKSNLHTPVLLSWTFFSTSRPHGGPGREGGPGHKLAMSVSSTIPRASDGLAHVGTLLNFSVIPSMITYWCCEQCFCFFPPFLHALSNYTYYYFTLIFQLIISTYPIWILLYPYPTSVLKGATRAQMSCLWGSIELLVVFFALHCIAYKLVYIKTIEKKTIELFQVMGANIFWNSPIFFTPSPLNFTTNIFTPLIIELLQS